KNVGFKADPVEVRVKDLLWSAKQFSYWNVEVNGNALDATITNEDAANDAFSYYRWQARLEILREELAALEAVAAAVISLGAADTEHGRSLRQAGAMWQLSYEGEVGYYPVRGTKALG